LLTVVYLSDVQGIKQLNWKSPGIKEFVDAVSSAVSDLNTVLYNVSHCVEQMQKVLDAWSATPLLERRDAKKLLNLDEERARVRSFPLCCYCDVVTDVCAQATQKFVQISLDGREISKMLAKINEYFGVGKAHPNWKDYVQFINQKVRRSRPECCLKLAAHGGILCKGGGRLRADRARIAAVPAEQHGSEHQGYAAFFVCKFLLL
jgi:hypothetical protein